MGVFITMCYTECGRLYVSGAELGNTLPTVGTTMRENIVIPTKRTALCFYTTAAAIFLVLAIPVVTKNNSCLPRIFLIVFLVPSL